MTIVTATVAAVIQPWDSHTGLVSFHADGTFWAETFFQAPWEPKVGDVLTVEADSDDYPMRATDAEGRVWPLGGAPVSLEEAELQRFLDVMRADR